VLRSLLVAFACLAVLGFEAKAHACSCLAQDAAAAFEGAASVFEGRVVAIDPAGEMQLEVRLRVVRTWKGADAEEFTVNTAANSAACGYGFEVDHSYLVYTNAASDAEEGHEQVSLCSNTKPIESAETELADLGPGSTPVDPGHGLGAAPPEAEQPHAPPASGGCASCDAGGPASPALVGLAIAVAFLLRRRRS
jgi:MYXO-CTERM domain-containing protein